MHRGMHFVPKLRSLAGLALEAPRTQKAASLESLRLCSQSWWPPSKGAAPQATVPVGPANYARLQPRGTGSSAENGTRAVASGARRRPDSDYRFTPGARQARPRAARLPRLAILLHSCSRPEQPPRAAAAAAATVAAAVAVRPDWLAAGAPALSHGPRRVRLTGGAAGAALAHGQANPGARGGAGRGGGYRGAGVPGRPPISARRRPTAARGPQPNSCGADALPPGRGGLRGRGAASLGLRSSRPHAAANLRSEAPIGRGTRLPGSRGPAPAPTSPPSPPSPYPWEGAQRGKGMVEF